jgi:hypothetical protein
MNAARIRFTIVRLGLVRDGVGSAGRGERLNFGPVVSVGLSLDQGWAQDLNPSPQDAGSVQASARRRSYSASAGP